MIFRSLRAMKSLANCHAMLSSGAPEEPLVTVSEGQNQVPSLIVLSRMSNPLAECVGSHMAAKKKPARRVTKKTATRRKKAAPPS